MGGIEPSVVDAVAGLSLTCPRQLQKRGAGINGDDARAERGQPAGRDAIAAGDVEDALSRPHGQQPFDGGTDQLELKRVAVAMCSSQNAAFASICGARRR